MPLGAGAVAGTDLPIDPDRTAELLGFPHGPLHATDAVAARDTMLRAVAAAASAALTLSRLATDLQLWSTQEFAFVEFPERLVGGSSAMPQKRNAFLLEHVKAKAALAVGAWTASAAAMKSTPFTNSIEVGTEAVGAGWPALAAVRDSVLLTQPLVGGARPVRARMEQRAREGFVTATVIANRLVARGCRSAPPTTSWARPYGKRSSPAPRNSPGSPCRRARRVRRARRPPNCPPCARWSTPTTGAAAPASATGPSTSSPGGWPHTDGA